MAETSSGLWAAATTGREMPRQNGKGDELEVPELWGLVQRAEAILHTVHDAVLLASQAQQRMLSVLEAHADLRRLVKRKWLGTGQQMIEMRNGGVIWYRTRTGGGGRGVDDIDRLVVDEAQHATREHLEAVSPTLFANDNPQLNAAGTSGLAGKSEWWWGLRCRALSPDPGAFGYVGHTAEHVRLVDGKAIQDPVDVEDRRVWAIANPAVHAGRGQGMAFLEEQLRNLGPKGFGQEHLGIWEPLDGAGVRTPKLPQVEWASSARLDEAPEKPVSSAAFDVDEDGRSAAIAIGMGLLAKPYVELVEFRVGVGWLPAAIKKLAKKWDVKVIGCKGSGPAGAQADAVQLALNKAGLDIEVKQLSTTERHQACGGLYTDTNEGRLERLRDQPELDDAGADAAERVIGGDAWEWDRNTATVPISPLWAITIARALLPIEEEGEPHVW